MPIIKSKQNLEKGKIRINMDNKLLEKIKQYCEWVGVNNQDDFFQQAAEYVLSKDKEWATHISQKTSA